MAQVLKCDGCGRLMADAEDVTREPLTIRRRFQSREIIIRVFADVEDGGELCYGCLQKVVVSYKHLPLEEV